MIGELKQIGAFAKRRQGQFDDVEPIEQVFSKRSRGDGDFEVSVGRGDHADIGAPGLVFADALVLFLLKKAEQLGLER